MSNEQKLREALRELMSIVSIHQKATRNNFAWAEMDFAKEALATTEPEPTGMPELPEPDWYMVHTPGADFDWSYTTDWSEALELSRQIDGLPDVSKITSYYAGNRVRTYGEQCWKARAAMAQVSDINVVESLTDDTKDAERYRWLRDDTDSDWAICEWSHDPGDEGYYRDARAPHIVDAAIDAAMAQGVK